MTRCVWAGAARVQVCEAGRHTHSRGGWSTEPEEVDPPLLWGARGRSKHKKSDSVEKRRNQISRSFILPFFGLLRKQTIIEILIKTRKQPSCVKWGRGVEEDRLLLSYSGRVPSYRLNALHFAFMLICYWLLQMRTSSLTNQQPEYNIDIGFRLIISRLPLRFSTAVLCELAERR